MSGFKVWFVDEPALEYCPERAFDGQSAARWALEERKSGVWDGLDFGPTWLAVVEGPEGERALFEVRAEIPATVNTRADPADLEDADMLGLRDEAKALLEGEQ